MSRVFWIVFVLFFIVSCAKPHSYWTVDENCNQIVYDCDKASNHKPCSKIVELPCNTKKCVPAMRIS